MSIIYFLNPFEHLIIPAQQYVDDFLAKIFKMSHTAIKFKCSYSLFHTLMMQPGEINNPTLKFFNFPQ